MRDTMKDTMKDTIIQFRSDITVAEYYGLTVYISNDIADRCNDPDIQAGMPYKVIQADLGYIGLESLDHGGITRISVRWISILAKHLGYK